VPIVKPETRPSKVCLLPYISTFSSTRWPIRRSLSCVSLKVRIHPDVAQRADRHETLADLHLVAGIHVARVTTPSISATIVQ
jgi:hypothetical protein